MPNFLLSPNMSLPVPVAGQETGPQYALDITSCMAILDSHNHTTGSGVQIPSSGININTDLSFNDNNITLGRSLRFSPQVSPLALSTDIGCVYESGVDLYYNDGLGNQIRITQSGALAGTPGSITGLVSPASATYMPLSSTFVWQSNVNTPANMDFGFAIFRNNSANSKGLTIQPPLAMASDYALTLPPLPGVQSIMTLDAGGNITSPWTVDNSTIVVSANQLKVPAGGIGITQLAQSARFSLSQLITTTTTVTAPSWATTAIICGRGGSGGGASGAPGSGGVGGGGGGGGGGCGTMSRTIAVAVTGGSNYLVTIGAAGGGGPPGAFSGLGNPGTAGGNTSFASLVIFLGGNPGLASTSSHAVIGLGGTGRFGQNNGGNGASGGSGIASTAGLYTETGNGGAGGASPAGTNQGGGGGGGSAGDGNGGAGGAGAGVSGGGSPGISGTNGGGGGGGGGGNNANTGLAGAGGVGVAGYAYIVWTQ